MANQNNLTYCKETTENHQIALKYSDCIQKIDSVCIKDGAKRTCFTKEVCLNLDDYEVHNAKRNGTANQKTMDFCFGVKTPNDKKKIVLVELRLNYTNWRNISRKELDEKINHSKVILGQIPIILNHYYFVFSPPIKNQAHNYLRRMYSNKNIVSGIELNDLKQNYFQ
jgi:hypothetical protein